MQGRIVKIQWTPFALNCLNEIYDYILFREKSPVPGSRLINSIFDRVEQLKEFPESGRLEPILSSTGNSRRFLTLASYKIIYQYFPKRDLVVVTDVFHTSLYPEKIKRSDAE
ncbi:MAG: hypothetical protein Roseis2KO_25530 [Roseivirga sp.]